MAPRSFIATALVLALAATASAGDPKDNDSVKRAIRGGQLYLKAFYKGGAPVAPFGAGGLAQLVPEISGAPRGAGAAWLAGLALIESGLPADDPVVAALARSARETAIGTLGTYELSLLIMFLDRVGASTDGPLIQFLTLRLLSGQCADGSWTYQCDGIKLNPVQENQLRADLVKGSRLTTPDPPKPKEKGRPREDLDDGPKTPKKDAPPPAPKEPEKPKGLHPSLERFDRDIRAQSRGNGARNGFNRVASGDRSNTQFATVALWCGRRHHVNVIDALGAVDKHFRENTGANDGWAYTVADRESSPAMTCAGLMGLAMGFGAKGLKDGSDKDARVDADAISKDPVLQGGLKFVGDLLAAATQGEPRDPGQFLERDLSRNLYFMWSLERVGMVYGLATIGKVDWYDWGSKALIHTQNRDGSWTDAGAHMVMPDNATAFALLFLSQANLAEDFANKLTKKVQDPGTSKMRSPSNRKELPPKDGSATIKPKDDPASPSLKTDVPAAGGSLGALADALVAASGAERQALLEKYRDTKGADYTDALAKAIPKLTGDARAQARDALAQRATRFTAATLNSMMADKDVEIRRAAALAAGGKGPIGEFADSLVKLIAETDGDVVQAARAALKTLSGEDHGPEPRATDADRGAAITAWRNWLAKQKQK